MKVVFTIDIPNELNIDLSGCKAVTKIYMHDEVGRMWDFIKSDTCYDLREMPEKYKVWDKHDYELGWNDCLEEICGNND